MSSPAGLQHSQVDFLTRWLPSSTRAGVILSPCPELAGSLRLRSSGGSPSLEPDDSFASDFAPLPASADSSCLGVDGFARSARGERSGTDGPVDGLTSGNLDGELDSLDEMASKSQDLPLMMKLEQLRKWQQHMQEQLKAHQLEELLRLQEEQQRLLGMMNGSQHCILDDSETSGLSEAEKEGEAPEGPTSDCCEVPQEQQPSPEQLPRGQDPQEEVFPPDQWNARGGDISPFHEHDDTTVPSTGAALTEDDQVFLDRPIKSGIEGQKTFEELVEEQLRLEEQRLKSTRQQQQRQDGAEAPPAPPKRAFLKRGEGLSRFTNTRKASLPKPGAKKDPKPPVQTGGISRSNSEPTAVQRGGGQRLPVQRKTATLNKENRLRGLISPPQDVRAQSKAARMKVLGSHQRQNTEEPESIQSSMQPNPVTKQQVGMLRGARGAGGARGARGAAAAAGGADPQESFEVSFQEKLQHWDSERRLESMELGEFELLEQAAEELSFSSNSSFVLKVLQMDQQHRSLHPRRLSSTPIKCPSSGAPQRISCAQSSAGLASKSSSMDSEGLVVKVRDDALQTKEDQHQSSDASSHGGSESGGQEVKPRSFPSTLCFPAPYDKRSYQDEDGEESDGVLSNTDESTLIEDEDSQQGEVVFDDDDTWNDMEDAVFVTANDRRGSSPAKGSSPPERTHLRKVAVSKVMELEKVPDPPPASQLMVRLFPSLKTKTQNAPVPPPPPVAPEPRKSEDTAQQVQSRQLRERLVELEIEIERFKKENAALTTLRQENEKNQEQLRKERLEFEQLKVEEMAKFEEYKKEENRKLQKERKVFEKHAAAARAVPDKKEREEIQMLKQQLSSLQEELRGKESRWTSTNSRLRQQIDSLSQENSSLRDEIRMLEKLRLNAWKKNPIRAEKDKEAKDKTPENNNNNNNMSSVTKGVKFATPLDSSPPQSSTSRRSSREISHGAAVGMKSSLRRPSGPSSSSSSSSSAGRRSEERSTPASRIQDKPPDQDQDQDQDQHQRCSPERDSPLKEAEHSEAQDPEPAQEVITHPDGRIEKVLAGGDRLIIFNNGTKKEVSADGLTVKVTFFNGDTKEVTADQRVIYFYADAQTTHITYPDGVEVLHFPNNQTEKHFPDGRKEITFPDQTVKNLFPGGREESVLTDGTIIRVNPDGTKEILFNTGQKEIHTADYKRREYPEGTVKTVYADGRQETRYPTGRLRIKDKDGNVVLDNGA